MAAQLTEFCRPIVAVTPPQFKDGEPVLHTRNGNEAEGAAAEQARRTWLAESFPVYGENDLLLFTDDLVSGLGRHWGGVDKP